MHILFVVSYYPSFQSPVTGVFFHDQAIALHRAGQKIGVLVTPRINITIEYIKRLGLSGLRATTIEDYFTDFPVYRMHWGWFPRVLPPIVAPIVTAAGINAFKQYSHDQGQPDVIHGHNIFYGGYLGARLSEQYGIPSIITEYSSSYLEGLIIFPGQKNIIRHSLHNSKSNFVCGRSLIKPLQEYAPEQHIDSLGCIIDTNFFSPATDPPPGEPFKFIVIAQLKERRKGFDVLLKAFAEAFRGETKVLLQIRGHGPLRSELDRLINDLDIGSQVQFLPIMSKEQLREFIRQAHCLVSSSYVETFGVGVAEAIACGKPVITTVSGGPEEFVTDRSGILVPPGNISALANAMKRMIVTYHNYNPFDVRRDIVERYSESVYVERLLRIYETAMTN